jgi:hypothetical protein
MHGQRGIECGNEQLAIELARQARDFAAVRREQHQRRIAAQRYCAASAWAPALSPSRW